MDVELRGVTAWRWSSARFSPPAAASVHERNERVRLPVILLVFREDLPHPLLLLPALDGERDQRRAPWPRARAIRRSPGPCQRTPAARRCRWDDAADGRGPCAPAHALPSRRRARSSSGPGAGGPRPERRVRRPGESFRGWGRRCRPEGTGASGLVEPTPAPPETGPRVSSGARCREHRAHGLLPLRLLHVAGAEPPVRQPDEPQYRHRDLYECHDCHSHGNKPARPREYSLLSVGPPIRPARYLDDQQGIRPARLVELDQIEARRGVETELSGRQVGHREHEVRMPRADPGATGRGVAEEHLAGTSM